MTLEERLAHIAEAKQQYGTRIPWLADTMQNDLKHALGDRNNSELIISPDGKIVVARSWSDPDKLRKDLEGMVGKSESFTAVGELEGPKVEVKEPTKKIARGVVPRVARPEGGIILKTETVPGKEGEPLYVKLRAEATRELIRGEAGAIHLGFHIDPIHHVHWNNLAAPMKYEITAPDGVEVDSLTGVASKVEAVDADADPREFLIEIDPKGKRLTEPLVVRVDYFACDDEDKWCKAASQKFTILWEEDRDAGKVQSRGGGRPGGTRPMQGKGMGRRPSAEQMIDRLDGDQDGKISKGEARGPLQARFGMIDVNEDGLIDMEELKKALDRMRR